MLLCQLLVNKLSFYFFQEERGEGFLKTNNPKSFTEI